MNPHSKMHNLLRAGAVSLGILKPRLLNDGQYRKLYSALESSPGYWEGEVNTGGGWVVSIVIPFWNTKQSYLDQLMQSLESQTNKNWELIMVDVSSNPDRTEAIKKWSAKSTRYKYHRLAENADIATNTNYGIDKASSNYIAFMDHDDTLSPHALNEVVVAIKKHSPDIIYSDEDKLTDNGRVRHSPYFKPDWSPHLFYFTNYTNHLSVIKKELVLAVGGLDKEYNGSQDYQLLLNIHAQSKRRLNVHHIPKILYHWREAEGSTARDHTSKMYAFEAAERALRQYFSRRGINTHVGLIEGAPGYFNTSVIPAPETTVAIVYGEDVRESIKTQLPHMTETTLKITYVGTDKQKAVADVVIEVAISALPTSSDWLDKLVGLALLPESRNISPRILAQDGVTVEYTGEIPNSYGLFESYTTLQTGQYTPTGGTDWPRNVTENKSGISVHQSNDSNKYGCSVVWSLVDFRLVES